MVTKVDIISGAFTNLGRSPISDIDESSAEPVVIIASKKYDLLLPVLLQEIPWRFATLTRNLNHLTDKPPVEGFSDAFQLPADYLNLERATPNIFYRIYENLLYTNNQKMQIDYRALIKESRFPAYFTLYLEYRLTADMAMPLTQQITNLQEWKKAFKEMSLIAKYLDSQQQPNDLIQKDGILTLHLGSSRATEGF